MVILGASGATESGFRARVGALTLLFVAGSADRDFLLEVLESALEGGGLSPIDPDNLREMNEGYEGESSDSSTEGDARTGLQLEPHVRFRASSKGEQFLHVAYILERWLHNRPDGPVELGPSGAEAIASLVCCWSATVMHALASGPLSLDELDRAVQILSRETVEEHVEAREDAGETRYALTDWMREGFAAVAAAARMELHFPEPDVAPPEALDVDAAFQLVLPLIELPRWLNGTCRLDVRIPDGFPVGAMAEVRDGRVVSSSPLLDEQTHTLITGTPIQWLDTLVNPPGLQLGVSGDLQLVHGIVIGLHETLFGMGPAPSGTG